MLATEHFKTERIIQMGSLSFWNVTSLKIIFKGKGINTLP